MSAKQTVSQPWLAAGVCALAGAAVFQFFGNANQGYIKTASLFWWWIFQWVNPASETEHGWLILGIAVWLGWKNLTAERRTSNTARPTSPEREAGAAGPCRPHEGDSDRTRGASRPYRDSGAAPLVALLVGLALHALGFAAQQARLSIIALLIFTWGVGRLGGGRRWGAALFFPLGFMVFAIPLSVLDSLGFWLRLWVIDAAYAIAHLAQIDVIRNGTQLVAPDGRYHYDVAAACSGVRSLMALTALSLLIAYLNFRSGWRRLVVLLLCLPLVYVGNVARITAIIFAAQIGGPAWGSRAHDIMGWGIFVIVLGGVLAGAKALERFVPESARPDREARRNTHGAPSGLALTPSQAPVGEAQARGSRPYLVAAAVIILAVGEAWFLRRLATLPPRGEVGIVLAADGINPVELPTFLGHEWVGHPAAVTAIERQILPADTGYSRIDYLATRGGQHVFVSLVLSGRDRTSIHRPELCLVGQGWTIRGSARETFVHPTTGVRFPAALLQVERERPGASGRVKVPQLVAYWFVGGDTVVATHWERIARDAWNRVAHARADRWAYVLLQTDATDGEAAAKARMQEVLNGTLPAFQRGPRQVGGASTK